MYLSGNHFSYCSDCYDGNVNYFWSLNLGCYQASVLWHDWDILSEYHF